MESERFEADEVHYYHKGWESMKRRKTTPICSYFDREKFSEGNKDNNKARGLWHENLVLHEWPHGARMGSLDNLNDTTFTGMFGSEEVKNAVYTTIIIVYSTVPYSGLWELREHKLPYNDHMGHLSQSKVPKWKSMPVKSIENGNDKSKSSNSMHERYRDLRASNKGVGPVERNTTKKKSHGSIELWEPPVELKTKFLSVRCKRMESHNNNNVWEIVCESVEDSVTAIQQ